MIMIFMFRILVLDKFNNLSLGFRVGNFRGSGLLEIIYSSYFKKKYSNKTKNLSLGLENCAIVVPSILFMALFCKF